jgi:hypothetical protein
MRPALHDVAFDGEGARANEIDLRFADRVIVRGRGLSASLAPAQPKIYFS